MYDSQLEEDGREEVEAREDQDVAMAAEMERSMVKKCVKWSSCKHGIKFNFTNYYLTNTINCNW